MLRDIESTGGSPAPLETHLRVFTPEGVELRLTPAGPVPRGLAWTLDLLLRSVLYSMLSVIAALGQAGEGILFVLIFLVEWFYPVWFELRPNGATPGKRLLGLRVVRDDGTPVDLSASVLRNLLRFADFLPALYGAGILASLLHPQHKRLGDLAAGTLVVHNDAERRLGDVAAKPHAPPLTLLRDERAALVDYAQRIDSWTPERAHELAQILLPVWGNSEERSTRERLLGSAAWCVGRRAIEGPASSEAQTRIPDPDETASLPAGTRPQSAQEPLS